MRSASPSNLPSLIFLKMTHFPASLRFFFVFVRIAGCHCKAETCRVAGQSGAWWHSLHGWPRLPCTWDSLRIFKRQNVTRTTIYSVSATTYADGGVIVLNMSEQTLEYVYSVF